MYKRQPLMHHQIFQNTRLLAGQCQGLPVDGGGARARIKGQRPAGQYHIPLRKLPQRKTADARLQLRKMKGLCQIVVGPRIQPLDLILHLSAGGEDQHLRLPVCLPQGAQHRHAVLPRQIQIQQHQIVPLRAEQLQRFFSVKAVIHAVRQPPQAAHNGFAQRALILNYQKVHQKPPVSFSFDLIISGMDKICVKF